MPEGVTHEEARAAEATLLSDRYGLDEGGTRRLIDDARAAGGVDGLLRSLAREGGVEAVYRTRDPEEE